MNDPGDLKRVPGPHGRIVLAARARLLAPIAILRPRPPTFFLDGDPGREVAWRSEVTIEVEQGEHHLVVSQWGDRNDPADDALFWVGDETVEVEFRPKSRYLPARLVFRS